MSKYTTQIRWLLENKWDFKMNDYPIFDELYRTVLNKKILTHYEFREIGFETPELFNRFLNRTLNEIMPFYNQLYKSERLVFDPLINQKISETYTKKVTGGNDSTSNGSNTANEDQINVHSDTPQGLLSIGAIQANTYASDADINKNNTTGTSSVTSKNTISSVDDYVRSISGINGNYNFSELLNDFRTTFLNIDMLIIEELSNLFMEVW